MATDLVSLEPTHATERCVWRTLRIWVQCGASQVVGILTITGEVPVPSSDSAFTFSRTLGRNPNLL